MNRFPISLLTSMVGLGLRSSPDRREEADTWRALVWGNNEAADHWEQSHFGLVWVGHLSWATVSELLFSSLGKHVP